MKQCTFIIFGATGDLTKRKLIPALYKLVQDRKVEEFIIIGAAHDDVTAAEFMDRARPFIASLDESLWHSMVEKSYYHPLRFENYNDFTDLYTTVERLEKKHKLGKNRLAYLATSSDYFCSISEFLGKSGLISRSDNKGDANSPWQRIAYEKPFGTNLISAQETNKCITQWFNEQQIFRIDHYLTKELVSNIVLVRFSNIIFEPLWNHNYIEYVEIIVDESIGLEGRGKYYDQYGILKDVVQNHVLQLLALIAMELPKELSADYIRDQKANVLKTVTVSDGFLGQYEHYLQEPGVVEHSSTPTFACLRLLVNTPRWKDVPFYVKCGKRLRDKNTSIHIKFKNVICSPLQAQCPYESDYLTIQIEPNASFSLQLNAKKPGFTFDVLPVQLTFSHNYVFGSLTPEAYEVLLEQIMLGDQSISVRFDEIEYAWSIIKDIESHRLPLYYYEHGSEGPEELKKFSEQYNFKWRA